MGTLSAIINTKSESGIKRCFDKTFVKRKLHPMHPICMPCMPQIHQLFLHCVVNSEFDRMASQEVDDSIPQGMMWRLPQSVVGKMPLTLVGRSRAADSTGFVIPELKIALDAGAIPCSLKPSRVFVTHTHTDHCFMYELLFVFKPQTRCCTSCMFVSRLTHYVSRAKPPDFYVPLPCLGIVEKYLRTAQELTNNAPFANDEEYQTNHTLIGLSPHAVNDVNNKKEVQEESKAVGPEDECLSLNDAICASGPSVGCVEFTQGGRDMLVRTFRMSHSVTCNGYGFYEKKRLLKAKYRGLPGRELAALRKQKVELMEIMLKPLFVFNGDTTTETFGLNPELLGFPVVITECSFLLDDQKKKASSSGHTVWGDLRPIVEAHPETMFVLIHFSHKYSAGEILEFFKRQELKNVHPMVPNEGSLQNFLGGTRGFGTFGATQQK